MKRGLCEMDGVGCRRGVGAALLAAAWLAGSAAAQSFQLITPPPGMVSSGGAGISYNGDTVAGWSRAVGAWGPGWSWTGAGGRQDVTGPGLPANTAAFGISGDGNWLVGDSGAAPLDANTTAFRYNRTNGQFDSLGVLPSGGLYTASHASGASLDGSVVVGWNGDSTDTYARAFRWTEAGGMQGLPFGTNRSYHTEALAVSGDGQYVAGFSLGTNGTDAMLWGPGTTFTVLPDLLGSTNSTARGINSSGSIVVGDSGPLSAYRGVIWVDGVVVDLGIPPGYFRTNALGVDDTGTVVIGNIEGIFDQQHVQYAALWSQASGWQPLHEYLSNRGVNIPAGLNLHTATGISRNGTIITGYGWNSDNTATAFVVTIPSVGSSAVIVVLFGAVLRRRRQCFS